jgi:hypothetical protein
MIDEWGTTEHYEGFYPANGAKIGTVGGPAGVTSPPQVSTFTPHLRGRLLAAIEERVGLAPADETADGLRRDLIGTLRRSSEGLGGATA